jgi:hypothetical protein
LIEIKKLVWYNKRVLMNSFYKNSCVDGGEDKYLVLDIGDECTWYNENEDIKLIPLKRMGFIKYNSW